MDRSPAPLPSRSVIPAPGLGSDGRGSGEQPLRAAAISRAELVEVQDQFISAWGQMASAWGVSRTMAEVYALLYISGEAMNTDQVMDRLRISRGNASMSLRSLVEWGIVSRVHRRGERKEFFLAEQDVWGLSRKVIRERLRREVLPLMTTLYELRDMTEAAEGNARRSGARRTTTNSSPTFHTHATRVTAAESATGSPDRRVADDAASVINDRPLTAEELALHNQRLDSLLELVQTIDKLGERFVGAEGKGLRLAASVLAKIV